MSLWLLTFIISFNFFYGIIKRVIYLISTPSIFINNALSSFHHCFCCISSLWFANSDSYFFIIFYLIFWWFPHYLVIQWNLKTSNMVLIGFRLHLLFHSCLLLFIIWINFLSFIIYEINLWYLFTSSSTIFFPTPIVTC